MSCRQLLSRPTQLALIKGESYGTCSRSSVDAVTPNAVGTPDFIKGPEEMADLVGRILAEKLAAQEREAAEAAAAQAALDAEQCAGAEAARDEADYCRYGY